SRPVSRGRRRRRRAGYRSRSRRVSKGDLVALDQRVRQELLAHALELGTGGVRIRGVDLQIDEPADARLGDREAEVLERALDGFALRIEDPGLRPDQDGRLHRRTTSGSAT